MSKKPEALRLADLLCKGNECCDFQAAAELRRLHVEVEALRTDAERYRWLRNEANFSKRVAPQVCMLDCLTAKADALHGDEVDAAIDAARSKE